MRKTCLDMVYELAKRDERIVFIGSDLGGGTLDQFKAEMPDRFYMEGVSEATVVGMAAGLALEGRIPYVNTIATFLTRRCFEQIVIDLCLHHAQVRLIGNGGGLVYAPLGPTHLAIEDLAIFRALPGMTILAPADALEMRRLMPATVDHPGPIYIRLAKGNDPLVTRDDGPFEIGKAVLMRQGNDVLLVTTGITLKVALDAAAQLAEQGVEAMVLHLPTVKPLDNVRLLEAIEAVSAIVVVEEHSIIGGLGSAVAEVFAEIRPGPGKRFKRVGIPDTFPDHYGSQNALLAQYEITAGQVAAVAQELLGDHRRRCTVNDVATVNKTAAGRLLEIVTPLHRRTKRDYVGRMMDEKVSCMRKSKEYGFDYWDGDRRYGYGGYKYDGRWKIVAEKLIEVYGLTSSTKILDVGCGKAHLLYELSQLLPSAEIRGLDISAYGLGQAPEAIRGSLIQYRAQEPYPWPDRYFDLVISLGCLHNLKLFELEVAFREIERVGRHKYVMVESYRNEQELFNLECWALTAESFLEPAEWLWLHNQCGYRGDYEFIYFE